MLGVEQLCDTQSSIDWRTRLCDHEVMSKAEKTQQADAWDWTLGDRMKKSLRVSGMSRDDMAEYLGVAPATVSTWMNDHIHPSTQTQRLWALKTGARYEWLKSGKYTPRDLNPEPTDSGILASLDAHRLRRAALVRVKGGAA